MRLVIRQPVLDAFIFGNILQVLNLSGIVLRCIIIVCVSDLTDVHISESLEVITLFRFRWLACSRTYFWEIFLPLNSFIYGHSPQVPV